MNDRRFALFAVIVLVATATAILIFATSKSDALSFTALALAVIALLLEVMIFFFQAEQSSQQERRATELHARTSTVLEKVESQSFAVQQMMHDQVSQVLTNLMQEIGRRAEPIESELESLKSGDARAPSEMQDVMLKMRDFLRDLPAMARSSVLDQHVSQHTGMTVGTSAWMRDMVRRFYQAPMNSDQTALAGLVSSTLSPEEQRIMKIVANDEMQKEDLVTYPLWEDWNHNAFPTQSLEAKGLLMGAESGTYFLTPTGRIVARYLVEHL